MISLQFYVPDIIIISTRGQETPNVKQFQLLAPPPIINKLLEKTRFTSKSKNLNYVIISPGVYLHHELKYSNISAHIKLQLHINHKNSNSSLVFGRAEAGVREGGRHSGIPTGAKLM